MNQQPSQEQTWSARLAQRATVITDFLAERRGIPIIIGFFLILLNFFVQFVPALGWFAEYDVLLHLGLLLAIGGVLVSPAL